MYEAPVLVKAFKKKNCLECPAKRMVITCWNFSLCVGVENGLWQVSLEASRDKSRAEQLSSELDDAKDGLVRSNSRAAELQKRHVEGR